MRRFVASMMLAALVFCAVASMMMQPAKADIIIFTAQLLPSNEVPPVTNADRNAFGSAIVTLDTTANTARFDFSVNQIASTAIILAHIHEGAAGVNGPVRVDSGLSPASPLTVVNGGVAFSRGGLTVPADVAQRLVANPAGFYFNVHSNLNPGGIVRGQLVRAQETAGGSTAPTLSEWGMILMTLLMLAAGTFFLTVRRFLTERHPAAGSAAVSAATLDAMNWRLFAKIALVVELIIAVALLVFAASAVDVMGALASGLVVAYIIHLLAGAAQKA